MLHLLNCNLLVYSVYLFDCFCLSYLSIRIVNIFEYVIISVLIGQACITDKCNASIYTQELKRTFFFPYYMMYCDIVIQSNYGCRLKIGNFSSECPTWRSTMKRSMIYWHQRIGSYNCMRALRYYWGTGPAPSISRVPKFVILQMCVLGAFYCRCVLDVWECSSQIAFSQSVWSAYWTQILCNL